MGFRVRFEQTKKRKKKKKGQFGKRIVVFIIGAMTVYTVFGLFMQYSKSIAPDSTLTTCLFAALFGELWELSKIKRKKEDKNTSVEESDETGSDE